MKFPYRYYLTPVLGGLLVLFLSGIITFIFQKEMILRLSLSIFSFYHSCEQRELIEYVDKQTVQAIILDNLPYHIGLSEIDYEKFLEYYVSWQNTDKKVSELIDSINRCNSSFEVQSSFTNDIDIVQSRQLWKYIMEMYKICSSELVRKYDKSSEYIEYILP